MFEVSNGALELFSRGHESNTEIFMDSKWARDSRRSGPMFAGNEERAAMAVAEVGKGADAQRELEN